MNKEQLVISFFQNKFNGDDVAFLDNWAIGKDCFYEGTHFRKSWLSLEQIAQKSIRVNVSDLVAKGAQPKYILSTLGIPKYFSKKQISTFCNALKKEAQNFGCTIIGGDTIASKQLFIDLTVLGHFKKKLLRCGIKQGDFLAFTGDLGHCQKDLRRLLRGGRIHKKSRFSAPIIRTAFMQKAASKMNAAIDISDGLFHEMAILSKQSRTGFSFLKKIDKNSALSGEEYEVLFVFSPNKRKNIERLAQKTRTKITIFAKAQRGSFVSKMRTHHF